MGAHRPVQKKIKKDMVLNWPQTGDGIPVGGVTIYFGSLREGEGL